MGPPPLDPGPDIEPPDPAAGVGDTPRPGAEEVLRTLFARRAAAARAEGLDQLPIHLRELFRDGGDARLSMLFSVWRCCIGTNGLADFRKLAPSRLASFRVSLVDYVHQIDVGADDPGGFVVLMQAAVTRIHRTADHTRLADLGASPYATAVRTRYLAAKSATQPTLEGVLATTPEGSLIYQRLTLPCSTDGARVDRLIVGVAPFPFAPHTADPVGA